MPHPYALRTVQLLVPVSLLLGLWACKSDPNAGDPARRDTDGDALPDVQEDRNQNGTVDPGETDPQSGDTDGDGIPDEGEVSTLACSRVNDRPFQVYDAPGADSMILVDAAVSLHETLRTPDNKAPGLSMADADRDVAAVLVGKRPADGVATPSAQRDHERRSVLDRIGAIVDQRTRAFTTVEGFAAEQAIFVLRLGQPADARSFTSNLAQAMLGGVQLTGVLPAAGAAGEEVTLQLLTIFRSPTHVVLVAAAAMSATPSSDQLIRLEELTDGTNVARHKAFTRHVCDQFVADKQSKADILWVVDDSGSMEDDQTAVGAAADAMSEVLQSADVDFRLAVTRTDADNRSSNRRGRLLGSGWTRDLSEFQDTIVVGANGGWEPGLETGLLAIDNSLPRTAPGQDDPAKLRGDAALVVIHLSDERDQDVECAACGSCDAHESEQFFCTGGGGQGVIDRYIAEYNSRSAVTFALVGDLPLGCQQMSTRDDFEPGQGYVEVANATGGQFGSLCGDMRQNVEAVARVAIGVSSAFELSHTPASATLRVAVGPPGRGAVVPRSRENGFDYDPVTNKIVFYGSARPAENDEIVVGYRRWDWANNPASPADPCDSCPGQSSCNPEADVVLCEQVCGDVVCEPALACLPESATCGDPNDVPPTPSDPCNGECTGDMVCNPVAGDCVVPCEQTGCSNGQVCSAVTHLCQVPNF